jgi:hypothetical protein
MDRSLRSPERERDVYTMADHRLTSRRRQECDVEHLNGLESLPRDCNSRSDKIAMRLQTISEVAWRALDQSHGSAPVSCR